MTADRKTVGDYRKEYKDLRQKQKALEARIRKRANVLCGENSDVVIATHFGAPDNGECLIKAKDYIGRLEHVSIDSVFAIIETIETELANRHPHKQTSIEGFN